MLLLNVDARPWYRTGWVFVPLLGAAAAAVAVVYFGRARVVPLCPDLGPSSGTLEDVSYVERVTQGADPSASLPMIVALHGRGQSAQQISALLAVLGKPARIIAPMGLLQDDEWIEPGLSPGGKSAAVADAAASLADFLVALPRCRPTAGKPMLVGYDEGADLAYAVAIDAPQSVAAVVGAGGVMDPSGVVGVPVSVIHGKDDVVASYADTSDAVKHHVAAGEPVTWIPMPGVGHDFTGALALRWLNEIDDLLP